MTKKVLVMIAISDSLEKVLLERAGKRGVRFEDLAGEYTLAGVEYERGQKK